MENLEYDYLEEIERFLKVLKAMKRDFKDIADKEKELAGVKNDIRHIYEFGNLDTVSLVNLSKIYVEKLRERREVIEDKRLLTRINTLFDKKYPDFIEEMTYVIKEIEKDYNRERNYYAKSILGQELIDRFSDIDDDLVTSASDEEIEELKDLEKKFNSGG